MPAPDRRLLDSLPEELASLPFGSPEFKDMNERLATEDEAACSPVTRAMPTWINLTGTTICNLKCFMCNQFLDPDIPKWIMADEVYDKVVAELYPFAKSVQFSAFGEPLMTPGMEDKLDDLERTHTKLEMVSNATLMMKESRFRQKLLKTLELVTFSMDGATRETYNSVRTGAEFNEVVDNIRRFADARGELPVDQRPGMNFNYIMMKRTVAEAPRFVEMVAELGGDHIVFNHLVAFHSSLRDESLTEHKAYANEHMDRTREVAAELGVSIAIPGNFHIDPELPAELVTPATNGGAHAPDAAATVGTEAEPAAAPAPRSRPCGPPPVKCWFLWKRVYIGTKGEIVPCCLAGVPFFGNLMDGAFRDVWNGDTYQTYRKHVFTDSPHGPCKNCYLIYPDLEGISEDGYLKY